MTANRREFIERSIASFLATGLPLLALHPVVAEAPARMDGLAEAANKANRKEVVIAGATGAFGALIKKTFYDPFTAATGIKVTSVAAGQGERLAKLQAQYVSGGNKDWDIVVLPADRLP